MTTLYLALDEDISFTWGNHSVAAEPAAPPLVEGPEAFGLFRLAAAPYLDAGVSAMGLTVQFLRNAVDVMSPYPSFVAGSEPSSIAAGDQDVVSEAALLAHLAASPARLAFLSEQAAPALPVAGQTVTGAAFAEAGFGPTGAGIFASGDFIMTFVDDRFGGYLTLNRPAGVTAARPDAAAAEIVLADNTTIRLTGLMQGWARQAVGSLQFSSAMFGLPGACFAA